MDTKTLTKEQIETIIKTIKPKTILVNIPDDDLVIENFDYDAQANILRVRTLEKLKWAIVVSHIDDYTDVSDNHTKWKLR